MEDLNSLINKNFTEISFQFFRLSRLLHKHRFAEAESFAIQFGLDVEVIIHVFIHSLKAFLHVLEAEETNR